MPVKHFRESIVGLAGAVLALLVLSNTVAAQTIDVAAELGGRNLVASAAPHPNGYWIVAWSHHRFVTERFTVYTRKVASTAFGRPIPVSNQGAAGQSDIVYNSRNDEFLLSWNTPTFAGTQLINSRIEVQRLDANGYDKLGIRAISQRVQGDSLSKLTFSPAHNTFLIGWTRRSIAQNGFPYGMVGLYSIGKQPLLSSISGTSDLWTFVTDVVYNDFANRYFVAVESLPGSEYHLHLVGVNPATGISDPTIPPFAKRTTQVNGFTLGASLQNSQMLAAWVEAGKLLARVLGSDGRVIGPLRVIQPSAVISGQPLTSTANGYSVAYSLQRSGNYELWVAHLARDGRVSSRQKVFTSRNFLIPNFLSYNPATGRTLAGWIEVVDDVTSLRLLARVL